MAVDFDSLVVGPCLEAFGEELVFSPATGGTADISGVFDEAHTEVTLTGDGPPVSTVMPIVGVQLSQFPAPPVQGDGLLRKKTGAVYIVKDVRPDGQGGAALLLNYVSG